MAKLVASRAVRSRPTLLMAITTKVHAGRDFFLQHVARLHRSVTLDAFQSRLGVRRVTKEDKIRNSVDRHPGDLLALLRCLPKFRDLRAVSLDRLMTLHAEVDGRNRRIVAFINPGVAEVAGQADVRRMRLMTERHRLRSNRLGKLFLCCPEPDSWVSAKAQRNKLISSTLPSQNLPPLFFALQNPISLRAGLAFGQRECDDLARKDFIVLVAATCRDHYELPSRLFPHVGRGSGETACR